MRTLSFSFLHPDPQFFFSFFPWKNDLSSFLSLKPLSICFQSNRIAAQNTAPGTISILHAITHHLYFHSSNLSWMLTLCSGLWYIRWYYDEMFSVCKGIPTIKVIIKMHKKNKSKSLKKMHLEIETKIYVALKELGKVLLRRYDL